MKQAVMRTVAILLFNEIEVLDFAGPFEVFGVADNRAGISAGVDMLLYVVGRLLGKDAADETARYMQYDYWQ